jgi:hypothetical protein
MYYIMHKSLYVDHPFLITRDQTYKTVTAVAKAMLDVVKLRRLPSEHAACDALLVSYKNAEREGRLTDEMQDEMYAAARALARDIAEKLRMEGGVLPLARTLAADNYAEYMAAAAAYTAAEDALNPLYGRLPVVSSTPEVAAATLFMKIYPKF